VYSITPGGEVAVTATAVYETASGKQARDLPINRAGFKPFSTDYSRFIYFDPVARSLKGFAQFPGPDRAGPF